MKNFQFFFIFVLIGLIVTIGLLELLPSFGESNENQRQPTSLDSKIVKGISHSPKIHPNLVEIMNDSSPEISILRYGASYQNDELDVYVYLKPEFIKNPPKNFNVIAQDENIVYTRLSLAQIQNIADLESVERISLPIKAVTFGHAVSQGVAWSFADDMQAAGFTGSGVTVAVIDNSFQVSNTEISGNIVSQSVGVECIPANMLCGQTAGNSHGTAVAEAVVDMAPDVNLRLYATGGLVDSNLAITDAISNNVDIITISFGFPGLGGDGVTGDYRDGTSSIAKKVNDAKNAGILVTVSAGNSGLSHWSGFYSISPVTPASIGLNAAIYESLMNFQPSASGLQRACLPVTDVGDDYYLTWNDWATSNQDYDFFLYSSDMITPLDFSVFFQTGIQAPIELIPEIGPLFPSILCLVVASISTTENHFFHIDSTGNLVNAPNLVPAGSLSTPADATGALTIGAIDQSTDIFETFSSQGPTDDSRNKPEICGPDNTLSHQSGINPFPGTSVSTPHVAGAAALLIEQTPGITVVQLHHRLTDEARFGASYSVDNLCGSNSGAVSLQTASTTDVYVPLGVSVTGCEVGSLCYLPSTLAVDQGTQVTWYNGDTAAITITSGTPGGGPDGIFDSSLFLAGSTFSYTFKSTGNFDYFDLVHPWATGRVVVNAVPCSPPGSGTWFVVSSCTLSASATAPGNVIVGNGAVLVIPAGITLDIDFVNNFLKVKFEAGVRIKAGGTIT